MAMSSGIRAGIDAFLSEEKGAPLYPVWPCQLQGCKLGGPALEDLFLRGLWPFTNKTKHLKAGHCVNSRPVITVGSGGGEVT